MPFAPISLDEMNKEVLAWDIYQMLAGGPLYDVKKVPVRFTSIDQYLDIFEPLLLEECRAQILRSMGESEPAPHHLKLLSIEQNEPFRLMRFQPPPPPEGGKPHFFETDIVLVSYEPLDMDAAATRGDGEDEDGPSTGGDFHALGLVASGGSSEHLSIKLHLPSQRTARMPQAQFKRLSMLHRVMVPSSGHWYVQKLGNMVTINREFQALYSMRDLPLCEALLAPGPSRLPASATLKPSEALLRAIETRFDKSQLRAIRLSLTGRGVTLIQGPPGTGKTKTILGILSVLLATRDARAHQEEGAAAPPPSAIAPLSPDDPHTGPPPASVASLLAAASPWLRSSSYAGIDAPGDRRAAAPPAPSSSAAPSAAAPSSAAPAVLSRGVFPRAAETDRHWSLGRATVEAPPRHVLVCAPSNAAIDEIVARILGRDGGGGGGGGGMLDGAGHPWVPSVVRVGPNVKEALLDVSLETLAKRRAAEKGCSFDAAKVGVLNDAQIVCTTLSCAGYAMFNSLKSGFDTVLVDEAAQAVEVSSLIPLKYACRRLILVGDPKQLPATVFSEVATQQNYEQSLFQRLQRGGQQVALLQTQYRMHPLISSFPRAAFYDGILRDSPHLAEMPPQPWHEVRVLAPYLVLDVADGRATEKQSSWLNDLEAQLALEIVRLLLARHSTDLQPASIGIISPYNAQVRHIRRVLAEALGAETAAALEVNSVDGFQGREKSVILLSTVRSDFGRERGLGVGFVKDERRINVSMTRAKHSLLILGHAATLRQAPIWERLIDDAKERGCLLKATSPLSVWFETASKERAKECGKPASSGGTKRAPKVEVAAEGEGVEAEAPAPARSPSGRAAVAKSTRSPRRRRT